ncbi:hypothetical protein [Synechococcus sp. CCY 9618]|uniref:hypothetical protein n=1 Tax=Synechococcus sp. CCY 9618 TaxID=2815602 RepID=UPI001C230CE1|nr:hypothetical protein [Synechococcus sp. CCY 9618]
MKLRNQRCSLPRTTRSGTGLRDLHRHLAGAPADLQDHCRGWVNGVLNRLDGPRQGGNSSGRSAELILQSAVELLARHWEWPIPVTRGRSSSGGVSLAFALEIILKGRSGHDRLINGHTPIPEATAPATSRPPTPTAGPAASAGSAAPAW